MQNNNTNDFLFRSNYLRKVGPVKKNFSTETSCNSKRLKSNNWLCWLDLVASNQVGLGKIVISVCLYLQALRVRSNKGCILHTVYLCLNPIF